MTTLDYASLYEAEYRPEPPPPPRGRPRPVARPAGGAAAPGARDPRRTPLDCGVVTLARRRASVRANVPSRVQDMRLAAALATAVAGAFLMGAARFPTTIPTPGWRRSRARAPWTGPRPHNARSLRSCRTIRATPACTRRRWRSSRPRTASPSSGFADDGTLRQLLAGRRARARRLAPHHAGQLPHRRTAVGDACSTSTPWRRPRAPTGSTRAPTACRRRSAAA